MEQKDISKIGELLANSPLDEEIKKSIIENIDRLPEYAAQELLSLLQKENAQLERVSQILKEFEETQNENWEELGTQQQTQASKLVDQITTEIEDELVK